MGTHPSDVFTSLVSSLGDINVSTLLRVCEALFGGDDEHQEFFHDGPFSSPPTE